MDCKDDNSDYANLLSYFKEHTGGYVLDFCRYMPIQTNDKLEEYICHTFTLNDNLDVDESQVIIKTIFLILRHCSTKSEKKLMKRTSTRKAVFQGFQIL